MEPPEILDDPAYAVVRVPNATAGVAWLRAHVARFSEGGDHDRRRALAQRLLDAVDIESLRQPGPSIEKLAVALGLPGDAVADVARVAASYQPHTTVTAEADAAVERLVEAHGGRRDEETAARIGLLVQAHDATLAMIAGQDLPVPATRRISPTGEEVLVDLADAPFGAGRHACPGRDHALALVDAARREAGPEPESVRR